jgi:hypothetical protein
MCTDGRYAYVLVQPGIEVDLVKQWINDDNGQSLANTSITTSTCGPITLRSLHLSLVQLEKEKQ